MTLTMKKESPRHSLMKWSCSPTCRIRISLSWLVLSWEPNGNVREFLASGRWELPERISLIKDLFDGLQHLHTLRPPICHGDLKSLNILVGSYYQAIITDFGSARLMNNESDKEADQKTGLDPSQGPTAEESSSHAEVTIAVSANQLTLTGPDWTLRWAAPELLTEDEPPSLPSDVWAAGWVCWEMMTDRLPFDDLQLDPAIVWNVIQAKVPVVYGDAYLQQIISLCGVMTDCWKLEPKSRPHAKRCSDQVASVPSVRPEGGKLRALDTKEPSTQLLIGMSHLHHSEGRYEQAASALEEVLSAESASDMEIAEALLQLGVVSTAQRKFTEAEEFHARAQEIYIRVGSDKGLAYALKLLGDTYQMQYKYSEARETYARAMEIYARTGAEGGGAHALMELGKTYYNQCDYIKAAETYAHLRELYIRIGDDEGQADALKRLGDAYQGNSKYAEAQEAYSQAQAIYTRIGDDHGGADALKKLADTYQAQSKYAEAEGIYSQLLAIFAHIGDEEDRVMTMLELGDVYWAQGKRAEAEETYARVAEVYPPIGRDKDRASTLAMLGETYHARSNYTKAEEAYTQALEIYVRIGEDDGRAHTLRKLGHAYHVQSKYTKAEEAYTQAQEIFARAGNGLA